MEGLCQKKRGFSKIVNQTNVGTSVFLLNTEVLNNILVFI